jgi:hypothetical protein
MSIQTLPVVKSLADCADYYKTVFAFEPQLRGLVNQLIQSWNKPSELVAIYEDTNPFVSGVAISLVLAIVFLIVSEVNRNYSQVDRCWSLLPTFYNAHFYVWSITNGLPSQRLGLLLTVSLIWSVSDGSVGRVPMKSSNHNTG